MATAITINGQVKQIQASGDTPLLWVIREELGLTGTKYGCGIAQCGACTVLIDGQATRSCVTPVETIGTGKVVTIEGLSAAGDHPVQLAWQSLDVVQCGFCQSGQILAAAALLAEKPKPSDADIDAAMEGNICRCATYARIKVAIKQAAGVAPTTQKG
jgi:isoquinoline 1-oxidoreductase subunit alpha